MSQGTFINFPTLTLKDKNYLRIGVLEKGQALNNELYYTKNKGQVFTIYSFLINGVSP